MFRFYSPSSGWFPDWAQLRLNLWLVPVCFQNLKKMEASHKCIPFQPLTLLVQGAQCARTFFKKLFLHEKEVLRSEISWLFLIHYTLSENQFFHSVLGWSRKCGHNVSPHTQAWRPHLFKQIKALAEILFTNEEARFAPIADIKPSCISMV